MALPASPIAIAIPGYKKNTKDAPLEGMPLRKIVLMDAGTVSGYLPAHVVYRLFRNAHFREEWYAGVELCLWKKARAFQSLDALPMYEEMIVVGAWWDIVDTLAGHGVGLLLREYPKPIRREMLTWSRSDNKWKWRTSILSQTIGAYCR